MFTEAFPIGSTPDLARTLAFYRDLLDAEVTYQFPAEGEPGYVALDIGQAHLGLAQDSAAVPGPGGSRIALWIYAERCDAAVQRLRNAGVRVTQEPADQPWGERIARVLDPDGNEVIIGERSNGVTQAPPSTGPPTACRIACSGAAETGPCQRRRRRLGAVYAGTAAVSLLPPVLDTVGVASRWPGETVVPAEVLSMRTSSTNACIRARPRLCVASAGGMAGRCGAANPRPASVTTTPARSPSMLTVTTKSSPVA